jgi:hypothetical protein
MAIPANRLRRPWQIGMLATNSQCAIRYGILRRRSHPRVRRAVPVGDSVFGRCGTSEHHRGKSRRRQYSERTDKVMFRGALARVALEGVLK